MVGGMLPSTGGCQEATPVVTPVRRLTHDQYANTLRDLLGAPAATAAAQLPVDDLRDDGFADPRTLIVTSDWAADAMSAAEAAARAVATSPLVPCDRATGDETCARQFITAFGGRAYRRPLAAREVDGLMKVYRVGAGAGGFAHGVEVAARAMLQSPWFLYQIELGQKNGSVGSAVKLTPHEVASRLSYLLWKSMPDEQLLSAAAAGHLDSAADVLTQARRMLGDPRTLQTLTDFHGKWLGLDGLAMAAKDPAVYPQFGDALAASMQTEFGLFVSEVMGNGDGRLESLLEAPFTFVDAALAPLYQVPAPATGFHRTDLDPTRRAGLLTNVGLLTAHTFADTSEPVHRGKFVRERLFCMTPPDPPPDLMVMPPTPKPGVSIRERLSEHSAVPSCQACHQLMDPIGFGFEAYDGIGRFRTVDPSGKPVDDHGVLSMTDVDGPFQGAVDLARRLAGSAQVRGCVVGTMLRYAQGPDVAGDLCVQHKMLDAFEAGKHDVRGLLVAVTQTDGFRYRRAIDGEVLP
jgi:hypothetical protein